MTFWEWIHKNNSMQPETGFIWCQFGGPPSNRVSFRGHPTIVDDCWVKEWGTKQRGEIGKKKSIQCPSWWNISCQGLSGRLKMFQHRSSRLKSGDKSKIVSTASRKPSTAKPSGVIFRNHMNHNMHHHKKITKPCDLQVRETCSTKDLGLCNPGRRVSRGILVTVIFWYHKVLVTIQFN